MKGGAAWVNRKLRGHHLLCTHGFRGMGYSEGFVKVMSDITDDIRDEDSDFQVQVLQGFDDACQACPHRGRTACEKSEDSNGHVLSMDGKVISHLGLTAGETYMKSDLVHLTVEKVNPDDLDYLCEGCSWLEYGVCKEGIRELKEKYGG
ncbi:[Fe-S]-binding protein [Bacillus sp. MKU004]|nr:[Fe-S]-binding protein [Bacillus sp. MKU004]